MDDTVNIGGHQVPAATVRGMTGIQGGSIPRTRNGAAKRLSVDGPTMGAEAAMTPKNYA